MHRCPTRQVFSGTGLELVQGQPRSDTYTTRLPRSRFPFETGIHSGESPTTFPKETSMPYSGFEPEPTRLLAEWQNHHIG
ncbi:hypothetical protein TNCV_2244961 [Trichonephila clavipes]|nr:hypothetical protein TNCV_2244961 [Trichonephila clavipes]